MALCAVVDAPVDALDYVGVVEDVRIPGLGHEEPAARAHRCDPFAVVRRRADRSGHVRAMAGPTILGYSVVVDQSLLRDYLALEIRVIPVDARVDYRHPRSHAQNLVPRGGGTYAVQISLPAVEKPGIVWRVIQ
jgi:hypothetical protein